MVSAQAAYHSREIAAAERHARQSIAVDPNFWAGHLNLAQALAAQGRFEDALAAASEAFRLAGNSKGLTHQAYMLGRMGRGAEALELLRAFQEAGSVVPPYEIALIHAGIGKADAVFEWLEKAYAVRDVHLVFLPVDPKMDAFRGDPRFQALLDRCGFMQRR